MKVKITNEQIEALAKKAFAECGNRWKIAALSSTLCARLFKKFAKEDYSIVLTTDEALKILKANYTFER